MEKAVVCLARNEAQAEKIITQLKNANFANESISVLFPDRNTTREFAIEKNTKAPEGAAAGGSTGGVIGGILGWLVGVGSIAIPGIGPFIAAGPIVAALSGLAVGATVGGLVGSLIGLGIPEYEAKRYEEEIKRGKILISLHTESLAERERAQEIFERAGADNISTMSEAHV